MAPLRHVSESISPKLLAKRGGELLESSDYLNLLSDQVEEPSAAPTSAAPAPFQEAAAVATAAPATTPEFEVHYRLRKRTLGTGASGGVLEGEDRRTRRRVAVKSHRKEAMTEKQLKHMRSEVEIHSGISHPSIVKLLGVYESASTVRLVMERLRGGELFDRVVAEGPLAELEAARAVRQLLQAVAHLHEQQIIHRDIKLENLVYDEIHKENIKLIDFGFATRVSSGSPALSQKCGTVGYAAPEVFSGREYTEKVDMWSIGSVVYIMLTAKPLFGGDEPKMLKKNKVGKIDFCRQFKGLPKDTQHFVRQLLSLVPAERPSAREALRHPWLQRMAMEEAIWDEDSLDADSLCDDIEETENINLGSQANTKQMACGVQSIKDLYPNVMPVNFVASC